jgi:hypothetical protein
MRVLNDEGWEIHQRKVRELGRHSDFAVVFFGRRSIKLLRKYVSSCRWRFMIMESLERLEGSALGTCIRI